MHKKIILKKQQNQTKQTLYINPLYISQNKIWMQTLNLGTSRKKYGIKQQ